MECSRFLLYAIAAGGSAYLNWAHCSKNMGRLLTWLVHKHLERKPTSPLSTNHSTCSFPRSWLFFCDRCKHPFSCPEKVKDGERDDWQWSFTCGIHRNGNIKQDSSYVGITFLTSVCKIFPTNLIGQIAPYTQNIIDPYRRFPRGTSTTD